MLSGHDPSENLAGLRLVGLSSAWEGLPEFIEVDLSKLEAGQSVHVSALKLPKGVSAVVHGDDATVAIAVKPAGATSADAEAK